MKSLFLTPYFKLILFVLILAGITSCSKGDDSNCCTCSQEVTTEGLNTVSCKINGEPWSNCSTNPGNSIGGESTSPVGFFWHNYDGFNTMLLYGYQFIGKNKSSLQIYLNPPKVGSNNVYGESLFTLTLSKTSKFNTGFQRTYSLDTTKSWEIETLKFDEEKQIISGVFFGTVKGLFYKSNGDLDSTILNITDGQFDLKY